MKNGRTSAITNNSMDNFAIVVYNGLENSKKLIQSIVDITCRNSISSFHTFSVCLLFSIANDTLFFSVYNFVILAFLFLELKKANIQLPVVVPEQYIFKMPY